MKRDEILSKLQEIKPKYEADGIVICGIFGSLARGDETEASDIDIAYELEEKLFFSKYGGFSGATRLAQVATELENEFRKKVDFVSINSINQKLNRAIRRDLVV